MVFAFCTHTVVQQTKCLMFVTSYLFVMNANDNKRHVLRKNKELLLYNFPRKLIKNVGFNKFKELESAVG